MGSILKAVCGVDTFGVYRVVRRVNDSAPRRVVRRVKDSASDAELVRFAKDHDDWDVLNRAGGKKEIRMSLDGSHYAAIIAKEGDDAEYEVRFGGFSDDVDSNVRNYTDLERAVRFAYGRGNDLLKQAQAQEGEVSDVRRRSVKDNRRVRWVRDSRGRLVRDSHVCRVKDDTSNLIMATLGLIAKRVDVEVQNVEDTDGIIFADVILPSDGGLSVLLSIPYADSAFPDDAWYGTLTFNKDGIPFGESLFKSMMLDSLIGNMLGYVDGCESVEALVKGLLRIRPNNTIIDADMKAEFAVNDTRKKSYMTKSVKATKDSRRVRLVRDSRGRLVRK